MHVRVLERFCVEGFLNGVLNDSFTGEKLNDSDALMMMVKVCFIFQLIVILRINNSYSREDVFWRDCRQVSSMLPWNTESLSSGKDSLKTDFVRGSVRGLTKLSTELKCLVCTTNVDSVQIVGMASFALRIACALWMELLAHLRVISLGHCLVE